MRQPTSALLHGFLVGLLLGSVRAADSAADSLPRELLEVNGTGNDTNTSNASDSANSSADIPSTDIPTTATTTTTSTSYIKDNYWQSISCGADYTLGVTVNGTGWKWGIPMSEREKAIIYPGTIFKYVAAGYTHSCSVTREGETYCWGRNHEGQSSPPRGVYFEQLGCGEAHTCGLTDRQELLCWGSSKYRRMQIPDYVDKWLDVAVGAFHTCGLADFGKILCWGHESYERLLVPFEYEGNILWEAVTCGQRHCCGLLTARSVRIKNYREEDNVVCWGDNQLNQLEVPGEPLGREGVQERFRQIAAGHLHTCGLTVGGRVWCWGDVEFWGIVAGIPIGETLIHVYSGGHHSCAMTADLRGLCWGSNHWGQSDVPVDDRTLPPTILDYSIHPMDIWAYAPFHRITRFDDAWPVPQHTFQWVHMALFIPEPAKAGSVMLVFTQVGGTEDIYSPHIMRFPSPRYDIPGSWNVNVSAFDLQRWHDQRWGINSIVESITSTVVNGRTEHRLVDGGRYRVDLTYEDTTGHLPSNHTIEALDVTYDLETLAPVVYSPVSGRTKQGLWVEYELLEPMQELEIFLRFTGSAIEGQSRRDDNAPHEIQLRDVLMTQGRHVLEIHLRDTETDIYFNRQANITRTFQAGFQTEFRDLTDGGRYTFEIRAVDYFSNPAATTEVPNLDYFIDVFTEPIQVIRPVELVDPFYIEYIVPERVDAGTLRAEIIWLQNDPSEPRATPDLQSPHVFWVHPQNEQPGERIVMKFGSTDLFKDPDDLSGVQAHPDISRFQSLGTPVISYLQPWSQYRIQLSYVDRFRNGRAYTNVTLWSNFSRPSAPQAPVRLTSTASSLTVGWTRGTTGGAEITEYDVEIIELPLNGSATAGQPDGLLNMTRTVQGQVTNFTTFRNLRSARSFQVRVRSRNVLGSSQWSPWATLRTKTTCGDGLVYDGEACDDGNLLEFDGCDTLCLMEPGWSCSSPLPDDPSQCAPNGMDGIRVGDEECDDCNTIAGDGCSPDAKIEPFWACEYRGYAGIPITCTGGGISLTADRCYVVCGDGLKHITEECDDGNQANGDGCSNECMVESGFNCQSYYPNMLTSVCEGTCGDGRRRGIEQCDDGNTVAGDGCTLCKVDDGWHCQRANITVNVTTNTSWNLTLVESETCQLTCSNGVLDPGEECDDANLIDFDGCTACVLDQGWRCDAISYRASNDPSSFCVPLCGDGFRITQGTRGEQCDDGNNIALDGCSPDCEVERGYRCERQVFSNGTTGPDNCTAVCGDGITVGMEGCDDGNLVGNDGCSATCQEERSYECRPSSLTDPGTCVLACGDGIAVSGLEACDDGNLIPNDGCSAHCAVETGYFCAVEEGSLASTCTPLCGDGLRVFPEQCDDGAVSSGDGCSADCQIEPGYVCPRSGLCVPICGDGIRLPSEECDDGNTLYGDGCDSSCRVEPHWECKSYILSVVSTTSVCNAIHGDGFVAGDEECDDGNVALGDGCDDQGRVEEDWVCCPTALAGSSVCTLHGAPCAESLCGNGQRDPGEECDDGNTTCCDGCSRYCAVEEGWECENFGRPDVPDICFPVCGDSFFVAGEECDDANEGASDGCGSNCRVETGFNCTRIQFGSVCLSECGDGRKNVGEECDDANFEDFDGCDKNCRVEGGWRCRGGSLTTRDFCEPICGDGITMDRSYSKTVPITSLEQCDTGGRLDPGCDALTCQLTMGYTCERIPGLVETRCRPVHGDGNLSAPAEECDDGNTLAGDGCGPTGLVEALWECQYDPAQGKSVCSVKCGDGRRHATEACDDGNLFSGDGCDAQCMPEVGDGGYECVGGSNTEPSSCRPLCGDGVQVHGEDCDDGNRRPNDGCSSDCQTEPMYYCTRAPRPFEFVGSLSECYRTCGDAIIQAPEECDDVIVPDLQGIINQLPLVTGQDTFAYSRCHHCRLVPGHLPGDGVRGNNGTNSFDLVADEECDDGNLLAGDGCSPVGLLEPGWSCLAKPPYVTSDSPPGDVCTPVCGDGLVVPGLEACDDGNSVNGDGCNAVCQVEPNWLCLPNISTPVAGMSRSHCLDVTPPLLLRAVVDSTYARMRLYFSFEVAPLNSTTTDGTNFDAVKFNCSELLDYHATVRFMGDGPICKWVTPSEVLVLLGLNPLIVPGDPVTVQADVLRRYHFSPIAAPEHQRLADSDPSDILEPRAIITGPQMTSHCADVTYIDSSYCTGHAGRPLILRWGIDAAYSEVTHRYNESETGRMAYTLSRMESDPTILFVRPGFVRDELDFFVDRHLSLGFVYILTLQITNVMGLTDSTRHVIYTVERPVPLVSSVIGRTYIQVPVYRWAVMAVEIDFPPECFSTDAISVISIPNTTWVHTRSAPGTPIEPVQDQLGATTSVLALRPGTLGVGRHDVLSETCVDVEEKICYNPLACNLTHNASHYFIVRTPTCGRLGFKVGQEGLCGKVLGCTNEAARLLAGSLQEDAGEEPQHTAADDAGQVRSAAPEGRALTSSFDSLTPFDLGLLSALEGATLELVAFPRGGDYIVGARELGEEDSSLMDLLRTAHDPASNRDFLLRMGQVWGSAALDPNRTTVFAAVVRPSSSATEAQKASLAWLRPRVAWDLVGSRIDRQVIQADPALGIESLGRSFLLVPPDQFTFGASVQVTATMALDASLNSSDCRPLRELTGSRSFAINVGPAAGFIDTLVLPSTNLIYVQFTLRQWASTSYPQQYRFEVTESDAPSTQLKLGDWSYAFRQRAFFMPRFDNTMTFHGFVRDPIGSLATTASNPLYFTSAPSSEVLLLSEYREGAMVIGTYTADRVTRLFSSVMQAAEPYGSQAMLQVLQDVAYRALGARFLSDVQNCTFECGPHGGCPDYSYVTVTELVRRFDFLATISTTQLPQVLGNSDNASNVSNGSNTSNASNASNTTLNSSQLLELPYRLVQETRRVALNNLTECVCEIDWVGSRCERTVEEAASQAALTKRVASQFRSIIAGTSTRLGLDIAVDVRTLRWFLEIMLRVSEDCRRMTLDSLETVANEFLYLLTRAKRAAISYAGDVATQLMDQLYQCLQATTKPADPLSEMPSPQTVLDELGSSSICRTVNGTETNLCYDLGTSVVELECPIYASPPAFTSSIFAQAEAPNSSGNSTAGASARVPVRTLRCQADLELGLADPYPCPCPVPEELFLGYGRTRDQAPLWETLSARRDHDLVWRTIAQIFWNHSALAVPNGTGVPDGVRLSAAAWFAMTEQAQNATLVDQLELRVQLTKKRGVAMAIRQAGEIIADGVVLEMVPGEAPVIADTASVRSIAAVPITTSVTRHEGGVMRNSSAASLSLSDTAMVEVDFNSSEQTGSPLSSVPPPVFAPFGAILWRSLGGIFSWLDGSIPVLSSVVQLRLFGSGRSPLAGTRSYTVLRHRFLVPAPVLPPACSLARPPTPLLNRCCNYDPYNWQPLDIPNCLAEPPVPPTPAPTPAPTPPPPTPPPPATDLLSRLRSAPASMVRLSGDGVPFVAYFEGILRNFSLWVPADIPIAVTGRRLRLQGGDLRFGRVCSLSGSLQYTVLEGRVLEAPNATEEGSVCDNIRDAYQQVRTAYPGEDWRTVGVDLGEAAAAVLGTRTVTATTSTSSTTGTRTSTTTSVTMVENVTTTFTTTETTLAASGGTGTTTTTTSTTRWCEGTSPESDAWCPLGYGLTQQPIFGDVILEDPEGFVVLEASGAQVLFPEGAAVLNTLGQAVIAAVTEYTAYYLFLQYAMLKPPGGPPGSDAWFTSLEQLHAMPRFDSPWRDFAPLTPLTTSTTTGTMWTSTFTSTNSATTTTVTVTVPLERTPPALLVHFLEEALGDYVDLLVEAASDGLGISPPVQPLAAEPFAMRATWAAEQLESWSKAVITADMPPVILGLEACAAQVELRDARPLEELLLALDSAIPKEWNESYWAAQPGGPDYGPTGLGDEVANASLEEPCVVVTSYQQPLLVTIESARGLRDADMMPGAGVSDPYVVAEVVGNAAARIISPTQQSKTDPVWNFRQLVPGSSTSDVLKFTVYDGDPGKRDDQLGEVELPPNSFLPNGFRGELQLERTGPGIAAFLTVRVQLTTGARDVECAPPTECDLDVRQEYECVAWSMPLMRWVPALGCRVADTFRQNWVADSGLVEVVCECEPGTLHAAVAVATKRPDLPPRPDRLIITSREYYVIWYEKLHRYNIRGAYIIGLLFFLALVHLTLACCAEVRWRYRARRVHSRSERSLEVQKSMLTAAEKHEQFRKQQMRRIRDALPEVPRANIVQATWSAVSGLAKQVRNSVLSYAGHPQESSDVTLFSQKSLHHIDEGRGAEHGTYNRMNADLALWAPFRAGTRLRRNLDGTPHDGDSQASFAGGQPVKVTIVGAKSLRSADWMPFSGTSDPYCVCEVRGRPQATFKTEVVQNTLNPVWDCEAEIAGFTVDDWLIFTIYDHDFGKADDVLGKAVVQGMQFLPGGFSGELPLAETGGSPAFLELRLDPGAPVINQTVLLDERERAYLVRLIRQRVDYKKIARLMGLTLKQVQDVAWEVEEPDRDDGDVLLQKFIPDPCPKLKAFGRFLLRSRPGNVWKACLHHHKLLQLPLDNQAWIFSAPERVAVFHMTLWWHALFMAVFFQMDLHHLPGQDPVCATSGGLTPDCLVFRQALWMTLLSCVVATFCSNVTMVLARGRSFHARALLCIDEDREEAFLRHFLGPFPMLFGAREEVKARLWNCYVYLHAVFGCCCCCCRRPRLIRLAPVHWLPSLVPLLLLFVASLAAWYVTRTMFFFSSTEYLHEVTYSEPEGFMEVVFPPPEQSENLAALASYQLGYVEFWRIFIPQLQRFVVLFLLSVAAQLIVLEPLILSCHLLMGEPTLDEAWAVTGAPVVRCIGTCCRRCRRLCKPKPRKVVHTPPVVKDTADLAYERGDHLTLKRIAVERGLILRVVNNMTKEELYQWIKDPESFEDPLAPAPPSPVATGSALSSPAAAPSGPAGPTRTASGGAILLTGPQ